MSAGASGVNRRRATDSEKDSESPSGAFVPHLGTGVRADRSRDNAAKSAGGSASPKAKEISDSEDGAQIPHLGTGVRADRSRDKAAKALGISGKTVDNAKRVAAADPELAAYRTCAGPVYASTFDEFDADELRFALEVVSAMIFEAGLRQDAINAASSFICGQLRNSVDDLDAAEFQAACNVIKRFDVE